MTNNKDNNRGSVRLKIAVVIGGLALASLVSGYFRSAAARESLALLPAEQSSLEELGDLAAEYRDQKMGEVDPRDTNLVRALMQQIAGKRNFGQALTRINEDKVKETERFVETKYTAELKGVTLKNCVEFLYDIQHSGKNMVPAELHMKRGRETDLWNANLAVHAFSVLE